MKQDDKQRTPALLRRTGYAAVWGFCAQERMVRTLNSAYPDLDPLDLTMTKLFKLILQLPGFDDDPHAVGEDQLEKIQMAWHEIRTE